MSRLTVSATLGGGKCVVAMRRSERPVHQVKNVLLFCPREEVGVPVAEADVSLAGVARVVSRATFLTCLVHFANFLPFARQVEG